MNYRDGVPYMVGLCRDAMAHDQVGTLNPIEGVEVRFPGDKQAVGDYKVFIRGNMPSHADICIMIAEHIRNGNMTYEDAVGFLEDVYDHGTDHGEVDPERWYLKTVLFWTTLQEEINYPQENGKQGRRMSFNRYAEAVAAAAGRDGISMDQVIRRANAKYVPGTLDITDPPRYYR